MSFPRIEGVYRSAKHGKRCDKAVSKRSLWPVYLPLASWALQMAAPRYCLTLSGKDVDNRLLILLLERAV